MQFGLAALPVSALSTFGTGQVAHEILGETGRYKSVIIPMNLNGADRHWRTLSMWKSTKQVLGPTLDTYNATGTFGSDPSQQWYWNYVVNNLDGTGTAISFVLDVWITYYVTASEPRQVYSY